MRVSEAHATEAGRSPRLDGRFSVGDRLPGSRALPAVVVVALAGLGLALRLAVADQSVFGDELSTYWIVSTNGLGGVVSTVHSDAEITPPLYFMAAWATTRIDLTPELLRAPSLLAGTAAIPLTYLLGLRTVGRSAALVAATLTALSPFMIFYSAEARGYALAIALVLLSTLALVAAVDDRRLRWWVLYGASTCGAFYTHYTVVFPFAVQLLWLLWFHPEARKAALLANLGAAFAFLPWLSGLTNDLSSPTTEILSELSPFDFRTVRISLEHWSIGYPYSSPFAPHTALRHMPGVVALVLLGMGVALAVVGLASTRFRESHVFRLARLDRRVVLIVALALSAPIGEALVSALGTNLFGTRNLAVSWPGFALSLAALLVAAGPRLRFATVVLAIGAFAIGAGKMLESQYERPDYEAVGALIDREASSGDVVVDAAAVLVTPGPLSGLDVALERAHRVFRIGVPQQRDHPFNDDDPILRTDEVMHQAASAAAGRRIFLVSSGTRFFVPLIEQAIGALPGRYQRVEARTYAGLVVWVMADRASRG